jgi:chromosome segregation ATPase
MFNNPIHLSTMKLSSFLFAIIIFYSCGPSAEDVAREIRKQDSIAAAIADSIEDSKYKITPLQTQYVAVDSTKNELQKSFDAALTRLDSLTGYNNELEGKLNDRTSEISKLKGQIGSILKKQHMSESEKIKCQALLLELDAKVDNLIKVVSKTN